MQCHWRGDSQLPINASVKAAPAPAPVLSVVTLQVEPWNVAELHIGLGGCEQKLSETPEPRLGCCKAVPGPRHLLAHRNATCGLSWGLCVSAAPRGPWGWSTELPWTVGSATVGFGIFWVAFN